MAKVTIEDISRQTGLSRGTVSRALNDRPDISAQTKQRVLEVCEKLGYAPSLAARSLATGRSYAIAVLLDDLHSVFAAAFLRGAITQAQNVRYAVHVAELGPDPEHQLQAIHATVTERIDGILMATSLDSSLASALRERIENKPLVACGAVDGITADVLTPDQAESGRLVARHLLQNGHRDILYVHTPGHATNERLNGFQEICRQHDINPDTVTLDWSSRYSGSLPEDLLLSRLESVRAIAASDDFLAINIWTICLRAGREPGRDIAIMGQGNERIGVHMTPTLTTVDFCGEEIGRRAMETSLQRVQKTRMDTPQQVLVPPLLIARESTMMLK
ncbi:MAG: LacI family DNA-binding transcriptional regulator [Planctomycetota bacterium]